MGICQNIFNYIPMDGNSEGFQSFFMISNVLIKNFIQKHFFKNLYFFFFSLLTAYKILSLFI